MGKKSGHNCYHVEKKDNELEFVIKEDESENDIHNRPEILQRIGNTPLHDLGYTH